MRIPVTAHTEQPWRIHEIAYDFQVEDVWSYRTPGAGRDDFRVMLAALRAQSGPEQANLLVRLLFAIRMKLGAWFGWDKGEEAVGPRVGSLRDRLPADLPPAPAGDPDPSDPFTPIYELDNERAEELANKTVHCVSHLSWVETGEGDYELRMAVLVKTNGLFGRAYLAAIAPFRYLIVYPALTRQWERAWRDRDELLRRSEGALS